MGSFAWRGNSGNFTSGKVSALRRYSMRVGQVSTLWQAIDIACNMQPHNELVDSTGFCLAASGTEHVVYSKQDEAGPISLDLREAPAKRFAGYFYHPQDGTMSSAFSLEGGGIRTVEKPSAADWVLHLLPKSESP